ncbi:MAG: glycosyltransferase family 87 protein [Candidatus Sulfotelmatobacter sp.]
MKIRIWLVLSFLVSAIAWLYAVSILGPWDRNIGEAKDGIKEQMGDLYPRWVGTRELLLRRLNPYGPEVTHEIQMGFYGHIVTQDYRESGRKMIDEQRFAYPLYVIFLMAPTIHLDFATVHRWAPTVLGLLAALSVPMSLDFLRWRPPWEKLMAITLFTLSSPQIVQGMEHQQLAIFVGFLFIAAAWCVSKNFLATAGLLLACSTLKPQMAVFPICFFFIWVAGDWRKRWKLFASFVVTLAILIGGGEWILSGWVGYFLAGAAAYQKYFPTTSVLGIAVGKTLGQILGGIIIVTLVIFAWRNRIEKADSREFANLFAAFLIGTLLAFPLLTPFNQVMLILPVMLLLKDWNSLSRFSRIAFATIVTWPWIVSLVLLLARPRLDSPNQLPLLPSFLVSFFPILLPLLLLARHVEAQDAIADMQSS